MLHRLTLSRRRVPCCCCCCCCWNHKGLYDRLVIVCDCVVVSEMHELPFSCAGPSGFSFLRILPSRLRGRCHGVVVLSFRACFQYSNGDCFDLVRCLPSPGISMDMYVSTLIHTNPIGLDHITCAQNPIPAHRWERSLTIDRSHFYLHPTPELSD